MAERGRLSANETPELVTAARNGDLPMVTQLLRLQHPLDARDKDGATALYWASCRGHEKISQILLDAGCDISARVKWGATAILAAADNGHEACLRQLVRRGADVNSANDRGDTPLHAAAYRGYLKVLRLLTAAHANPFLKNCSSMTPLQEAVAQGKLECVRHLKDYMRATPGPIFLSSPTLPCDVSGLPSMTDNSCQTWPYDAPGLSKQLHKYNSFPLQKNDEINALTGYTGHNTVTFGSPVLARVYDNKSYSIPQESKSFFETRSVSSDLNLLIDSNGENLAVNNESGLNISFDSFLPVSVPVQTLQERQVSDFKSREPRASASQSISHVIEAENQPPTLPAAEKTAESISLQCSRNVDASPHFSHQNRERFQKAPKDLQEQQSQVKVSSQESFPAKDHLRHRLSPTTRAGVREVIPGVDAFEFLEQLQVKVVELQEKLAKSETENTELKDQLHATQKENTKLKIENSILRSSDKQSTLRTRGDSEEIAYSRHTSYLPDLQKPRIFIAERADSEASFGSRRAIESSEHEESTS